MRIGNGYDVHRLTDGRKLILGGVEIPYEKGLLGHSDADVLVHAVMDSILGALSKGDIGKLFPDSSAEFKDISSILLLKKVNEVLKKENYAIINIDSIVVAQAPKLAPYIDLMRKNIADALETDVANVSVKATTTEKLGFEGRGEGISSYAVCLLEKIR
ncbi:MAG: 2-C-methyl-D-erythritol 2,4-cyclodiphosphate synthase [Clostridia bacterium]|nr:2-C-methyl-D-erythritol 2,4-cyclodiphosphate synthase [Clostridia bacterium]